jgi:hypothetical protein
MCYTLNVSNVKVVILYSVWLETPVPPKFNKETQKEKEVRSKEEETASIIIFIRSFHLHGSAAAKCTHLSASPKLQLFSGCITFFLICCSHPDFGIFVGHF